jgi:ABC-type multidrug transport system permease subunit
VVHQDLVKREENAVEANNPSNGRVMLIDGTSVIYRAYFKLLGMSWYWLFFFFFFLIFMLNYFTNGKIEV